MIISQFNKNNIVINRWICISGDSNCWWSSSRFASLCIKYLTYSVDPCITAVPVLCPKLENCLLGAHFLRYRHSYKGLSCFIFIHQPNGGDCLERDDLSRSTVLSFILEGQQIVGSQDCPSSSTRRRYTFSSAWVFLIFWRESIDSGFGLSPEQEFIATAFIIWMWSEIIQINSIPSYSAKIRATIRVIREKNIYHEKSFRTFTTFSSWVEKTKIEAKEK